MTTARNKARRLASAPAIATPSVSLRPLTARSAIASTLLGTHPPSLPGATLVRSCEILGIAAGTARVAMTRMVANGELAVDDGRYTLIGPLRERQQRQDESRRGEVVETDDPWWSVFAVRDDVSRTPAERASLRARFRRHRYAEVREGVWTRPANLPTHDDARAELTGEALHWRAEPDDPAALAAQLWDLRSWAAEASRLRRAMSRSLTKLERSRFDVLPTTFALDAAVIRHLQADPLLPSTLLPARWPGADLRTEHAAFDAAFNRVWREALRRR